MSKRVSLAPFKGLTQDEYDMVRKYSLAHYRAHTRCSENGVDVYYTDDNHNVYTETEMVERCCAALCIHPPIMIYGERMYIRIDDIRDILGEFLQPDFADWVIECLIRAGEGNSFLVAKDLVSMPELWDKYKSFTPRCID